MNQVVARNGSHTAGGADNDNQPCDWRSLRSQLLSQWVLLTKKDLEGAGDDRKKIAAVIQEKYGVSARMVENYILNLEHALPVII